MDNVRIAADRLDETSPDKRMVIEMIRASNTPPSLFQAQVSYLISTVNGVITQAMPFTDPLEAVMQYVLEFDRWDYAVVPNEIKVDSKPAFYSFFQKREI
jgi:hypothetical protein